MNAQADTYAKMATRVGTLLGRYEIDAELGQRAGVTQPPLDPIAHARAERFGIADTAHFGHGGGVKSGELEHWHGHPPTM